VSTQSDSTLKDKQQESNISKQAKLHPKPRKDVLKIFIIAAGT
jgi:hypothetical protein